MGQFESFIGVNFWTALFVLLNTLLVYAVAKHLLFGPVQKLIAARRQEIDDAYAAADAAKAEAEQLQADYQQKLTDAQATAEQLVKEAAARGSARREEIVSAARAEASAMLEKAGADIEQEKKKAINEAKDEISSLAMDIAGKIVGRELNDEAHAALVDQFINELGE